MTIYTYRGTLTAAAGAASQVTLKIPGGLLRQFYVLANTSTTVFRATLSDENGVAFASWGYHTGNLNDLDHAIPVEGALTVAIANASPTNDTFTVLAKVQES